MVVFGVGGACDTEGALVGACLADWLAPPEGVPAVEGALLAGCLHCGQGSKQSAIHQLALLWHRTAVRWRLGLSFSGVV